MSESEFRPRSLADWSLEGLRGLAAINVVLAHFALAFLPVLLKSNYPDLIILSTPEGLWVDVLTVPLLNVLFNGHFAVLVFFVLSGYVMTQPAFENNPKALSRRLAGRYLRLNGPIFVALWLSYLLDQGGGYLNDLAGQRWGSRFFLSHFKETPTVLETLRASLWGGLLGEDLRLDPPLWSLRIEWLGSMALLLIHRFAPRRRALWAHLIGGLAVWLSPPGDRPFYLFLWAGSLLPRKHWPYAPRRVLSVLFGLVGLFLGAYRQDLPIYQQLPTMDGFLEMPSDKKTFYNGLGGFLLVLGVLQGFSEKFLSSAICRWLGKRSYALYLLHFPLLASLIAGLSLEVPQNGFGLLILLGLYLGTALGFSDLFTRIVDQRFIGWGRDLGRRFFP